MRQVAVGCMSWLGLMAAGCSVTSGPIELRLSEHVQRPERAAVVFLVDGFDLTRMNALIAAAHASAEQAHQPGLPNIERCFVTGGVGVDNAITSIPALTYPNLVSLMTGRFPGHHGILGNQWFDRSTLQIQDYLTTSTYQSAGDDFSCPTVYEMLGDRFTVNVQCPVRRGMWRTADNTLLTGCDWLVGTYTFVDARAGSDLAWVGQVANETGRWPSLIVHYFPGVDEIGHHSGSQSTAYARAACNVDRQIGRVVDAIERAGLGDRTLFVLLSDHGHVPLPHQKRAGVVEWLRKTAGMRVRTAMINHYDPVEREHELRHYDAIVVDSGYRRCAIHLRGPGGWHSPPTIEQIEKLVHPRDDGHSGRNASLTDLRAVELAAYRVADGVRVVSRPGSATIERRIHDGRHEYRVIADGDRLLDRMRARRLPGFALTEWHASREWLEATSEATYPDFVPQIVEMFDSPRAGDIVLFASEDCGLGHLDEGGHGSCLAWDMRIPMFFRGPGLISGARAPFGRLVDVVPTLLEWLGVGAAAGDALDGVSLLPELRRAGRPVSDARQAVRRADTPCGD